MLRGDHRIFDEPNLDDDEDDWENDSPVNDHYKAAVTEEEDTAEVADGDETEHDGEVREATEADNCLRRRLRTTELCSWRM